MWMLTLQESARKLGYRERNAVQGRIAGAVRDLPSVLLQFLRSSWKVSVHRRRVEPWRDLLPRISLSRHFIAHVIEFLHVFAVKGLLLLLFEI